MQLTLDQIDEVLRYEKSLLGELLSLAGGERLFAGVADRIDAEQFFDRRHRSIWAACCKLHDNGLPIDAAAVFRQTGKDAPYLVDLITERTDEIIAAEEWDTECLTTHAAIEAITLHAKVFKYKEDEEVLPL